ncbi:Cysteamine dioxygenase [Bertholletia excelsa]
MAEQTRDRVGRLNNKVIDKRRCKRRRIRSTGAAPNPMALQRLFLSCRQVFEGPGTVPSPDHVQKLCRILDGMVPADVGLSKDHPFFKPKTPVEGKPRITQTIIYQCKNFSLCIFFLPATAVIPLHNHPGMTVFSKLLLGTMHIKAYDWADPGKLDESVLASQRRLARLKANSVFTAPCSTSVLYPTSGGNIHAFTAITPCAVLDVLGPPYSKEDGRDCSYYRDIPYSALPNGEITAVKEEGESYGWLEEIEMPEESRMEVIQYPGPRIMEVTS